LIPNHIEYDFDKLVKFKIFISSLNTHLSLESKNDIRILLIEDNSAKYQNYIRLFNLNERYDAHRNLVIEMINKRKKYPDSKILELVSITKQSPDQIKKDIFGELIYCEDLSKRPLSKLTRDISEELGLI